VRGAAFWFASEVERRIEALSDDEYRLRRGEAKDLLEEWYPISRLALHLKMPGLGVDVEAFGDSRRTDGRIIESGFRDRSLDIEVTYVDDYEGAMRRELLCKDGVVFGAGPISRDKRTGEINSTCSAVDFDYDVKKVANGIAQRIAAKAAKNYPPATVLLVAFEDMKISGRWWWEKLLTHLDALGPPRSGAFSSIYILNCATNEIAHVA
jgi:hypothetical protein